MTTISLTTSVLLYLIVVRSESVTSRSNCQPANYGLSENDTQNDTSLFLCKDMLLKGVYNKEQSLERRNFSEKRRTPMSLTETFFEERFFLLELLKNFQIRLYNNLNSCLKN